jgi:uncharacterized short protein YbdD (DUF466 family)
MMPRRSRQPHNPSLSQLFCRAEALLCRIMGAPDYTGYLAHFASRHPTEVPLSRFEFEQEVQRERYNRPGNRCC